MDLKPFQRLFFSDQTLSRFQDNVSTFLDQLKDNVFIKGSLIEDVALSTTAKDISHKLGVKPRGYLVVKCNQPSFVYCPKLDENFLTLQSSINVTVSLWVF